MRLPVALTSWAQHHKSRVSEATYTEACRIVEAIEASPLRNLRANDPEAELKISSLFATDRGDRAAALVRVTQAWLAENSLIMSPQTPGLAAEPIITQRSKDEETSEAASSRESTDYGTTATDYEDTDSADTATTDSADTDSEDTDTEDTDTAADSEADTESGSQDHDSETELTRFERGAKSDIPEAQPEALTEAGLIDHVKPLDDADDPQTMYGPSRRWTWLGIPIGLLIVAGLAAAFWWFGLRDANDSAEPTETSATKEVISTPVPEEQEETESAQDTDDGKEQAEAEPTPLPTPSATPVETTPVPPPAEPSNFADTTPILNSGTAELIASTYQVSPANRVVLTGHRGSISGLVVDDEGRVITGGSDMHLVDWGDDVPVSTPVRNKLQSEISALALGSSQDLLVGLRSGEVLVFERNENMVESDPVKVEVFQADVTSLTQADSGHIVATSADGQIAAFTADSEEPLVAAIGEDPVAVVAIGNGFVVGGGDGILRYFAEPDFDSKDLGTPLELDLGTPITALSAEFEGMVVAGFLDGSVMPVELGSEKAGIPSKSRHSGAIRSMTIVELEDSGHYLVTGGDDATIVIWEDDFSDARRTLFGHGDSVLAIGKLSDQRLVSVSADATGRVWDLEQPIDPPTISAHASNLSVITALDATSVLTGDTSGRVVAESVSEENEPAQLAYFANPVSAVAASGSGTVAAIDAEGILALGKLPLADPSSTVLVETGSPATTLTALGDSRLVLGQSDGTLRLLDLEKYNETANAEQDTDATEGEAEAQAGAISFADLEVDSVQPHEGAITALVAVDDTRVVSAGADKKLRIVDFEEKPVNVALHPNVVDALAVLSDGRVISGSVDGIYVWSLDDPTGSAVRFAGHHQRLLSIAQSDKDHFISTDIDGRVRRWDLNDPEAEAEELLDIPGVINPVATVLDDETIVVAASRGFVTFK